MITRIHVNQHNIKANARNDLLQEGAEGLPVITVKDYKQNRKGMEAHLFNDQGAIVASVIYRPDNPLPCGAKVWIETKLDVQVV